MVQSQQAFARFTLVGFAGLLVATGMGCQAGRGAARAAVGEYVAAQREALRAAQSATASGGPVGSGLRALPIGAAQTSDGRPVTLVAFMAEGAESRPAAAPPQQGAPPGYWRESLGHQIGRESADFATRDLWRGFKNAYVDVENLLILTGAMGASVAIRESGVDGTIRDRVRGHRQLGDADEPIQILGHPGTHFAGAGVAWLGTALLKDVEGHEFSRSLVQALAVNGLSTVLLKVSTNTRGPDGDDLAWPSGHTSSAFAVAGVVNEHYGPLAGVPAIALAGLAGYQRIDSREHDFSDVVFGGVLGYVIGTSVASGNKAEFPKLFGMQVIPFTDPETGAAGLALWKQQ